MKKTIIILLMSLLFLVGCKEQESRASEDTTDSTKLTPNYNDYERRPQFRVDYDGSRYYVGYKTWDMENWERHEQYFLTREDAQAVVDGCRQKCEDKYYRITGI